MLKVYAPSPALRPYVLSYWIVEDLAGAWAGRPIRTAPANVAMLSFNLGRPNRMVGGSVVPKVSLLGVQTCARAWRSDVQTYFAMAMLTVAGLVHLFPDTGAATGDQLVELACVLGEREAREAHMQVTGGWRPELVCQGLEAWLVRRLACVGASPGVERLVHAHDLLAKEGRVATAAEAVGVSRRQLSRLFQRHLGVTPKTVMDLERLQASLRVRRGGGGDALAGYSDQAHQIRTWRRRLGTTPGAYRESALAAEAREGGGRGARAFYF